MEKAREALKIYRTEMDEFQSKILATKRDFNEAYMKMMEELDDQKSSEKLTKLSQVQTDLKTGTILESSNYNFEQAQSDIKFKLYRAKFTESVGIATLHDNVPPRMPLGTNPLYAKAADSDVYVTHPNHGFQVGDNVLLQNVSGVSSVLLKTLETEF